jgi:hypothetical protein
MKSSYFSYNNLHRRIKSKGHLYIYLHQVFTVSMSDNSNKLVAIMIRDSEMLAWFFD